MRDELIRRYDDLAATHWWLRGKYRFIIEATRGLTASAPSGPALDVGCGPGNWLEKLDADRFRVGVDLSFEALKTASGKGISCVNASADELPFSSSCMAQVWAIDIIEHLVHDKEFIAEAVRVLKPGGLLVIGAPAFQSLWGVNDVVYEHKRRYRLRQVTGIMRGGGLDILKAAYVASPLFVPLWILRRYKSFVVPKQGKDDFFDIPPWINRALERMLFLEAKWVRWFPTPFGLSILAAGRKPYESSIHPG